MRFRDQNNAKRRVAKAAVRWLIYHPKDSDSLDRWLRQSPVHKTVYLEIVQLDRTLGQIDPQLLKPPTQRRGL